VVSRDREIRFGQHQDPGKDLFAYLFLLTIIISLLFLTQGLNMITQTQNAPENKAMSLKKRIKLKPDHIGRLVRKDGQIYLCFQTKLYLPKNEMDIAHLKNEGFVHLNGKREEIYIWKNSAKNISLEEYLETFKHFNEHNINIIFVDK